MVEKYVWMFEDVDASKELKSLKLEYGGKAAGLIQMTQWGLPIPEGFVIPTKYCLLYQEKHEWPAGMKEQVNECMSRLEKKSGRKFGDPNNPLLVSVRSGAPESMPGMMDTVLNLGLTKKIAESIAKRMGERFAWDAWRRFIMMYADIVMGTGRKPFDEFMDKLKAKTGKKQDIELNAAELKELSEMNLTLYKKLLNKDFPENPYEQLYSAINAVFHSWDSERAVAYRKLNKIPNYGTAVTVMRMVFGNLNDDSGTGVLFTRDANDGEKHVMGEFLINAQGEDVVAGVRTPIKLDDLKEDSARAKIAEEILSYADRLEKSYKDMQDCEFTVEDKKVYFLQTRNGKRTATAAVKIAIDMLHEGLIDEEEAILRLAPEKVDELLYKRVSLKEKKPSLTKGCNASPGAVTAKVTFDVKRAQKAKANNERVILVRKETKPEDFPGMIASVGILTSRGGKTCHAAVVARGIGLPGVVGAGDLQIDEDKGEASIKGNVVFKEGDKITIDGLTGNIWIGDVELVTPEIAGEFKDYLILCDKHRKLGVRTNADTPQMAADALKNGAEGIGLCRTERMFNAKDRLPKVVDMIVAETLEKREKALEALKPLQKGDFSALFKVMDKKPVIVRLLDPPLHEFLPNYKNMLVEFTESTAKGVKNERTEYLEKMIKKYEELHEDNGMLGHRGVRLGNTNPEIYSMQVRALVEALIESEKAGVDVQLEIMLPMTVHVMEVKRLFGILQPVAEETLKKFNHKPKHSIKWGTMIETPRACCTAEQFGKACEFFSFGTNDLTQTVFAFSRDDVEGKFMQKYLEFTPPILKDNPFEVLDTEGVGRFVQIAVEDGRKGRADAAKGERLEIGVCGETGGDPQSIMFYAKVGLDYISASPFRVPVARVAAAHAAILMKRGKL